MDMAALEAGEHIAVVIADADIGGLVLVLLLSNVVFPSLPRDMSLGPPIPDHVTEERALWCEDLNPLVRPVGDAALAGIVKRDAVRQGNWPAPWPGSPMT